MGWEIEIDTSGQSNDCVRVCNVKMKKNLTGAGMGHISENVGVTGVVSSNLNFFQQDYS